MQCLVNNSEPEKVNTQPTIGSKCDKHQKGNSNSALRICLTRDQPTGHSHLTGRAG